MIPAWRSAGGIDGGSFLGSGDATNLAYASQLANYVASMKTNYNVNNFTPFPFKTSRTRM